MSNILKVSLQEAIKSLKERGWSDRRIAKELRLNRRTVKRYGDRPSAKCTISIPGSEGGVEAKCTISIAGEVSSQAKCTFRPSAPRRVRLARRSAIVRVGAVIVSRWPRALPPSWNWDSVRNAFIRIWLESTALPVRINRSSVTRRVSKPANPSGSGAWNVDLEKKHRWTSGWARRLMTATERAGEAGSFGWCLSYSRKGYSEAVQRQDTETFLRCLENAVRSFGGAPLLLNLDNLKAAVLRADWFDPEINPKLAEFCRHYGMSVLPCRPVYGPSTRAKWNVGWPTCVTTRSKAAASAHSTPPICICKSGKRRWPTPAFTGPRASKWPAALPKRRVHLQPLPSMIFPAYQEARRTVHRDSYVEVARAYYEVPPEYIGREVWVRWDGRCVRVFNDRLQQVQMHVRIEPGKFSRSLGVMGLNASVRSSCRYWIERAAVLGEACGAWAQQLVDRRGPEALRTIMALCTMIKTAQ